MSSAFFVLNKKTKVFHLANCYCIKQILKCNKVKLEDKTTDLKVLNDLSKDEKVRGCGHCGADLDQTSILSYCKEAV